MAWPTLQDYNEAVQNPSFAFTDTDLRGGQPELTPLGLPKPISGGFACVYKIQSSGQLWAARCFQNEVSDQQQRYDAISTYLNGINLSYSVSFSFLPTGIKVQGRCYPLVKMEWVQGESLSSFVERSLGYPPTLWSLAKAWAAMVNDLQAANIAHGDLQHGNVIVVGDRLRLIDYDGMFVPALASNMSSECGHRNYQHPARTAFDYGPHLDNFSAWVIYVSIVALAVHPDLWSKHRGGDECLLFRREDFLQPNSSALLRDLNHSSNAQVKTLAQLFTRMLNFSPQDVPSLDGKDPINAMTATSAGSKHQSPQHWWADHFPTPTAPTAPAAQPPAEPVDQTAPADASWLIDFLPDALPPSPIRFSGPVTEPKMVFYGSCLLYVITALLGEMAAFTFIAASCAALGLNLLFCLSRFKADTAVAEFAAFKIELKRLLRQDQEQHAIMNSLAAEQSQSQNLFKAEELKLLAAIDRLQTAMNSELNQVQMKLDAALNGLDERRRKATQVETSELQEAQHNLGDRVAIIDRKIVALAQIESNEKDKALVAIQDRHIDAILRQKLISHDRIPGIGPAYTSRLQQAGIISAADIDGRVPRVAGIGNARHWALLNWRIRLAGQAKSTAPTRLPQQDAATIENRYVNERRILDAEKARLQTQLLSQVGSIRQRALNTRQALNQEEQHIRNQFAQEKSTFKQSSSATLAALNQKGVEAKNRANLTISECSEKLRQAQKRYFALRWQLARHEREEQRFSLLSFPHYLKCVVALY